MQKSKIKLVDLLQGPKYSLEDLDLNKVDVLSTGYFGSALMTIFISNVSKKYNLDDEKINSLVYKSDLHYKNNFRMVALSYYFSNKENNKINLNKNAISFLIKNSPLDVIDLTDGVIPIFFALKYHRLQNLQISLQDWDYLIENSNLYHITTKNNYSILSYLKYSLNTIEQVVQNKIYQKIFNEKNPNLQLLFFDLNYRQEIEKNYLLLPKIWQAIDNKDWFVDYLLKNNFQNKFASLLLYDDIKIYIEKRDLQHTLPQTMPIKKIISKL